MPNEIITVQLGNYANYIGTHWWNIQESSFVYKEEEAQRSALNHDILFREGLNYRGDVTFTPRLIFVDRNGSLGSLPKEGTLYKAQNYDEEEAHFMWDEDVEVHERAQVPRNQYLQDLYEEDLIYENGHSDRSGRKMNGHVGQAKENGLSSKKIIKDFKKCRSYDFDNHVNTWTDFKRLHFHPRSALLLNHHFENADTFGSWMSGIDEAKSGHTMSNMEETVRFYAEECDYLQGFHVLCDMGNGFGGLACSVLEYLHDEFLGKSSAVFPTCDTTRKAKTSAKTREEILTMTLTLSGLLENSTLLCPLSLRKDLFQLSATRNFPHLIYDSSLSYHTSAVLAAALEGATRPYRLKDKADSLLSLTQCITSGNCKLLGMSGSIPLPYDVMKHDCLPDLLCDYSDENPWVPLTPCMGQQLTPKPEYCFSQAVSLNGLSNAEILATPTHPQYSNTLLHRCSDASALLKLYLEGRFPASRNIVSVVNEALKVASPFPHIFSNEVLENGFVKYKVQKQPAYFTDEYTDKLLKDCNHSISPRAKQIEKAKPIPHTNGNCSGKSWSPRRELATLPVKSIPVMTSLSSSSYLASLLKRCHTQASLLKRFVAQNRHSESFVEQEALEEACERFKSLEQDYSAFAFHDDSESSDD